MTLNNNTYDIANLNGIPNDIPMVYTGKDRIGKDSIVEDNIEGKIIHSGLFIPLIDNTSYEVPVDKLYSWSDTYKNVDVMSEIQKMIKWSSDNPDKRKTIQGVEYFINNWLSKEQEQKRTYRK